MKNISAYIDFRKDIEARVFYAEQYAEAGDLADALRNLRIAQSNILGFKGLDDFTDLSHNFMMQSIENIVDEARKKIMQKYSPPRLAQ